MLEAIQYYQSLAEKFDSRLLCVPGIVVIVLGLCIWLSGLRWRKVLGAFAGGSIFAGIGICAGIYEWLIILLVALIGIAVGTLIEKVMLGIFGTILAAAIALMTVSVFLEKVNPHPETQNCPRWQQYEAIGAVIDCDNAAAITREMGCFLFKRTVENIKSASLVSIAVAAIAMLTAGFIAIITPRVFISVVSSTLGSAVISAGILMLLFYKGTKPINYFMGKIQFYAILIFVMLVFGTMVQLVLSPAAAENAKDVPGKNGDKK